MADRIDADEARLRYEPDMDRDFQRRWAEARHLSGDQVDAAWRHGFEARDRFADRPFSEVRGWLHESWTAMGEPAPWNEIEDLVRSGYERYKGAGFGSSTDPAQEASARFRQHTIGGSSLGGGRPGDGAQQGEGGAQPGTR